MDSGLNEILRQVSRSMYLSFRVLPGEVRGTLGLGYLLCRAADTIADTSLIPREHRLGCLGLWESLVAGSPEANRATLEEILSRIAPRRNHVSERRLLETSVRCLEVLGHIEPLERGLVAAVVNGVVEGMRMDLRSFTGSDAGNLCALSTLKELEDYCRWIGGSPGDFWTRLCLLKFPGTLPADEGWISEGIRMGMGLQMTNILRDVAADLRIGRCYLPLEGLARVGLKPEGLLEPSSLPRLKPLLNQLLRTTVDYLASGESYILKIPNRCWSLRAAAGWPLLLAYKTLARVAESDSLLNPRSRAKVPRWSVYATLLGSPVTVGLDAVFRARCRGLRERVQAATQNPLPLS